MGSLIQWPTAKYWTRQFNSWLGCVPCSPACEHCYAAAMTKRFGGSLEPHLSKQELPPRKGVVFCGNMTDIAGEWREIADIAGDMAVCAARRGATYLWLTKRPERMVKAMHYVGDRLQRPEVWFMNHYFGITAESQEWWLKRRGQLADLPKWAKWWVSCEPLLGPIDMGLMFQHPLTRRFEILPKRELPSWVVVGCESGPHHRPCKIEWVESIVEQCFSAGVPVFVKQICLPNGKFTNKVEEFPGHLRIRQVPWAQEQKGEK